MRGKSLWAATLLASTGCSIIAVRPSPTVNERTGVGVCATYIPPALDVVAAPGFTLLGVSIAALGRAIRECGSNSTEPGCQTPWQIYVPAGIFTLSAIYGFWAMHHCNAQLDEMHQRYLADHPEMFAPPVR